MHVAQAEMPSPLPPEHKSSHRPCYLTSNGEAHGTTSKDLQKSGNPNPISVKTRLQSSLKFTLINALS